MQFFVTYSWNKEIPQCLRAQSMYMSIVLNFTCRSASIKMATRKTKNAGRWTMSERVWRYLQSISLRINTIAKHLVE